MQQLLSCLFLRVLITAAVMFVFWGGFILSVFLNLRKVIDMVSAHPGLMVAWLKWEWVGPEELDYAWVDSGETKLSTVISLANYWQ